MTDVRARLRALYPTRADFPYCMALEGGEFDRDAILCAEVVELYRALLTRDAVKEDYQRKVRAACNLGVLSEQDAHAIGTVIDDEGSTDEHADHLDIRLQLFSTFHLPVRPTLRPDAALDLVNARYLASVRDADVFGVVAIHAAIEDWYVPLAGFFRREYLRRGFSAHEVETYEVHESADVWHSGAGFAVLERHVDALDWNGIERAVRAVFSTAVAYDTSKLRFATGRRLDELLVLP